MQRLLAVLYRTFLRARQVRPAALISSETGPKQILSQRKPPRRTAFVNHRTPEIAIDTWVPGALETRACYGRKARTTRRLRRVLHGWLLKHAQGPVGEPRLLLLARLSLAMTGEAINFTESAHRYPLRACRAANTPKFLLIERRICVQLEDLAAKGIEPGHARLEVRLRCSLKSSSVRFQNGAADDPTSPCSKPLHELPAYWTSDERREDSRQAMNRGVAQSY